ncbi:MAG: hypothetical protein PHF00_05980 [Elusimicrobia bacterium]|nr:hypothetical protein [Elusimicrobiota bacterium]
MRRPWVRDSATSLRLASEPMRPSSAELRRHSSVRMACLAGLALLAAAAGAVFSHYSLNAAPATWVEASGFNVVRPLVIRAAVEPGLVGAIDYKLEPIAAGYGEQAK